MTAIKKNLESFYSKLTGDEKRVFIKKALDALTKSVPEAHLRVQELNKACEEKLGVKFSKKFQKEVLENLGYKRDTVNGKVVYTGVLLRKEVELEKKIGALLNESRLDNDDL